MRSSRFAILLFLAAAPTHAATLIIRAEGVRSSQGMLYAGVCDRAFDEATCPYKDHAAARPGAVEMRVPNVKPGLYAVAVFHDTDGDGELSRNFIGLPSEPYGFSNDVSRIGMPNFKNATIEVKEPTTTVVVPIR